MAQVNWTYDELVLAAALVQENDWKGILQRDPRAISLSDLLRQGQLHEGEELPTNFRSPASIQRKTFDLITTDPAYHGKPTKGGKLDVRVMREFRQAPDEMRLLADAIRSALSDGETFPEDERRIDPEALEGGLVTYLIQRRERDPGLRAKKLRQSVADGQPIACVVCGFNFGEVYGERGEGYIEVHHVTPLYVSGRTKTTLKDLVLLCANCHRMCHRSPWMTPSKLAVLISSN